MLSFGVTVLPDPPYQRLIELTKLAEAQGFEYGWTYDSHVLWQESMPVMALLADQTSTIKLGHMVTNPAIRDPTVLASAWRACSPRRSRREPPAWPPTWPGTHSDRGDSSQATSARKRC